jgi:hypothetical protein
MALRYIEGFSGWDTTTFRNSRYFVRLAGGGLLSNLKIDSTGGRDGKSAFFQDGAGGTFTLPGTDTSEIYLGFAWKPVDFGTVVESSPVVRFMAGASATCAVLVNRDGSCILQVRGTNQSPVSGFNENQWQYVEVYLKVNASTGSFIVKKDGVTITTVTGNTLLNTNDLKIEAVQLGVQTTLNLHQHYFDDIYICDETGSKNNTFLGDSTVDIIRPNGVGASSDWAPVGSGSPTLNYTFVNQVPHDGDTSYVESNTVGHKDLYLYEDVNAGIPSIHGLQVNTIFRKEDFGPRLAVNVVKSSATEEDSSEAGMNLDYYSFYSVHEDDPDAAAAWTAATVNAAEFGLKMTA